MTSVPALAPEERPLVSASVAALIDVAAGRSRADLRQLADSVDGSTLVSAFKLPLFVGLRVAGARRCPLSNEQVASVVDASLTFCSRANEPLVRRLGAAVVATLHGVGVTLTPGALVAAAQASLSTEEYPLTTVLAHAALACPDVPTHHQALAHGLLAVVTDDPEHRASASALAAQLGPEHADIAERVRSVRPRLLPRGETDAIRQASNALGNDSLATTAQHLLPLVEPLEADGDDLIRGYARLLRASCRASLEIEEFRAGLQMMLSHLRSRSAQGTDPIVARAGLRNALLFLAKDGSPEAARLAVEYLESRADLGIGALDDEDFVGGNAAPAAVAAALGLDAADHGKWLSADEVLTRSAGSHLLYLRAEGHLRSGSALWACHVTPSGGVGIHLRTVTGAAAPALAALGSGDLMRVAPISRSAVNEVGRLALPDSLVDAISNSGDGHLTLTVVPDAATWAIPWSVIAHPQLGPLSARCDISVTPSVHTLRTRPQRALISTGAVEAFIDRRIPAGAALESRLARFTTATTMADIQVVYGHGAGQDLAFGVDTGGEVVDAFSVNPAEIVILASCRSGTRSPSPMPLGLVSATMLRGATTVIAGLWDLPTDSTARITGDVVELLLTGSSPASALRQATDGLDLPWPNWAGLGIFGWA